MVSIVTPCYNSSPYIIDCIASVKAQTYSKWEMIIVDDASTDNSISIIRKFIEGDPRFNLISLNENIGAAKARNVGLDLCTGSYLAFLDSDDIWEINKLDEQLRFMQSNNYSISFTSYKIIDEDGQYRDKIVQSIPIVNFETYLKNTIIGFSSSIINLSLIREKIIFRNIRTRQDADMWITLFKKGYVAHGLNIPLMRYRVHKNSISANKIKAIKQIWILYYNVHDLGLLKSLYYYSLYIYNAIKKRLKSD